MFRVEEIGHMLNEIAFNILDYRKTQITRFGASGEGMITAHNNLCRTFLQYGSVDISKLRPKDLSDFESVFLAEHNSLLFTRLQYALNDYLISKQTSNSQHDRDSIYSEYVDWLVGVIALEGLGDSYIARGANTKEILMGSDTNLLMCSLVFCTVPDNFKKVGGCLIQ